MSSQARLRTSCDICQSSKVKCNRDKPECHRCKKNGLRCVYSPLRRMGRPKKRAASSQGARSGDSDAQFAQVKESIPLNTEDESFGSQWPDPNTPSSLSLIGSVNDTPFAFGTNDRLASSASLPILASAGGSPCNSYQDAFAEGIQSSADCQSPFSFHQPPIAAPSRTKPNEFKDKRLVLENGTWPMMQNVASFADTFTSHALNGFLPFPNDSEIAMGRHLSHQKPQSELPHRNLDDNASCTGNFQFTGHQSRVHRASRASTELQIPCYTRSSSSPISNNQMSHNGGVSTKNTTRSPSGSDGPCQGQCNLNILHRLAWLEHSRGTKENPLTIDVVLIAERDTRMLKEQLFECGNNTPEDKGCVSSRPSSLMSLVLLAECVTSILEDLFGRAAILARERERDIRSAWSVNPDSVPPGGVRSLSAQQSAARFERSIRGVFDRNISCPIPEANCDLSLGKFRVGGEAKSRAMKHILRRRLRELLATLVDVKTFVGRGSGIVQGSVKQIAEDLLRRVESLQGRIELAE
ncbi:hypothetical protein N7504_004529 [Penicillium tannophilum]|nr:hypothetical protein N7504_004529 [Penicillium tannophilum]